MTHNFIKNKKKPCALIHVTHWKAGSQWINKIFHHCAFEKIIQFDLHDFNFVSHEILPQKVYPAWYISYEKFKLLNLSKKVCRLIIIRDLRDTLISAYFSKKISHKVEKNNDRLINLRNLLNNLSQEDGLIYLIKEWLPYCAIIQSSWLSSNDKLLKYEELISNDNDINTLTPIISNALLISEEKVMSSILANRFDMITNGRKRGIEDIQSHERKGIAGDWKNYFTPNVKNEFKLRYGDLLIQTGYEKNFEW